MGNLSKTPYIDHQTVITASNLNAIQDSIIANTSYTTSSTSAETAAKTASLSDFVLSTGAAVKVKFTYGNTATTPSLNINSTGAKYIKQYGTTAAGTTPETSWCNGEIVEFVYDGTNWIINGRSRDNTVKFESQTLTAEQKEQARNNISAISASSATAKANSAKVLEVKVSGISSLPCNITNENITSSMVVVESVLSNPEVQLSDWTVTTNNGSATITGTINGGTDITLFLERTMDNDSTEPDPANYGLPTRLKVMQNNVGEYYFGYKSVSSVTNRDKMTNSLLSEKIANYREFYGEIKPDILFVQEYKNTLTAPDETGTANSYATLSTLYDPLFAYNSVTSSDNTGEQIFSAISMSRVSKNTITGTDGNGHTKTCRALICRATIRNRGVALVSTALTPTPTSYDSGYTYQTYEAIRSSQLSQIMSMIADYDDVVIGIDVNTGTPSETAKSEAENVALMTQLINSGYTPANYTYFGQEDTYLNHAGVNNNYYRKIDNIFVKGRIKITNFKALIDETTNFPSDYVNPEDDTTSSHTKSMYSDRGGYNLLASDHIPIVADIYLY